jgi:hypothetical protein
MLPDTTADMTPNVNDLSKTIHQLCVHATTRPWGTWRAMCSAADAPR